MMNKQEIYDYLLNKNIWHQITDHKAVYNMAQLSQVDIPYPEADAKNLFVRDDKKKNYYLITVKGDKRVNLKEFRKENKIRPLSFASDNDLMDILKLSPGSVTPLGILNDEQIRVKVYLDNDNTATVWLKIDDLVSIIEEHGNAVQPVALARTS